ncbi:hypothetical protein ELH72_04035 [Rhizobium ruizarguesonis]|nr:hypothetical protein ELH72_04035 [Rhizobium ruizarguesonis]
MLPPSPCTRCGDKIVTTREAFENIRVRQRHYSPGTLLGEAIRVSPWLPRCTDWAFSRADLVGGCLQAFSRVGCSAN